MGKESDFWCDDVSKLRAFGAVKRLEDLIEGGVSDVIYCVEWPEEHRHRLRERERYDRPRAGWLELKRLKRWPKRVALRLPHYTLEQAKFLERWGRAGMGAFLLAKVEDDYLLWDWRVCRALQAGVPRGEAERLAAVLGRGAFPMRDILLQLARWPLDGAKNR